MMNKLLMGKGTKILAGVVLVGALGYYNCIDKPIVGNVKVGDMCPDFTVNTFVTSSDGFALGGEPFNLAQSRGKVVIINFWATYCAPCKAEIPEFEEIQKTYQEDVIVITLDGETSFTAQGLCDWIK